MTFKRHNIQEYIESRFGCTDVSNWATKGNKESLKSWTIDPYDEAELTKAKKGDEMAYVTKALFSFLDAIASIANNHYSWSIVKLYYTIFYSLRFEILYCNHFLVRCSALFRGEICRNTLLKEVQCKKARGDHQLTIQVVQDLYSEGKLVDFVLDNTLYGESPYHWMLQQRERINYRLQDFPDPQIDDVIAKPAEYILAGETMKMFEIYAKDNELKYLFDTDHSMVSIPFYRICEMYRKTQFKGIPIRKIATLMKMANNLHIDIRRLINLM